MNEVFLELQAHPAGSQPSLTSALLGNQPRQRKVRVVGIHTRRTKCCQLPADDVLQGTKQEMRSSGQQGVRI